MNRKWISAMVICSACCCNAPAKTRITFDMGCLKEMRARPSYWSFSQCSDELIYLVAKGDEKGIEAAIAVIPALLRTDVVVEELPHLARNLYNNIDSLSDFDTLPTEDRILLFEMFDRLRPVDWELEKEMYLERHCEFRKKYSRELGIHNEEAG